MSLTAWSETPNASASSFAVDPSAKRSRIARAFCAVSFVAPRQLDWMLLMTGLAALVEDRVTLLRSAIVLALTFHVCSAAAVFAVVKCLVDADWGWVAAACWLINPLAFLIAVQATEASVYGVSALGLLIVHLRVVEARMAGRQPSWRLVAAYGLALGVLCLARMDGATVVALAIAWLAWPAISRPGDRLRAGASAFAAAAVAVLVVSPWWIFSASLLLWLAALILTYGLAVVERQIWWLIVPCLTIMLIEFMTVPWALGTVSGGVRIGRALHRRSSFSPCCCSRAGTSRIGRSIRGNRTSGAVSSQLRRWCRRRNGSAPSMPASPPYLGSARGGARRPRQSRRPDGLGRAPIRSIRGIKRNSLHCRRSARARQGPPLLAHSTQARTRGFFPPSRLANRTTTPVACDRAMRLLT